MAEAKNAYPEIEKTQEKLNDPKYDLLKSASAHAKMEDVRSGWSSDATNHRNMANVAEIHRISQWRQLVAEATAPGPGNTDQHQAQMLMYQGLTQAGKPFAGSNFALPLGGNLPNNGAMWTARCADTLVEICKPGMDRQLASTLVPSALCDNKTPEADKLRLLKGVQNLATKDQAGDVPFNRQQEIALLSQALKADREKQFDTQITSDLAPAHNRGSSRGTVPKEVTQYQKHEKEDQVQFQTALMKRLADLHAEEAIDLLNVVKDHPTQPALSRVAEEQLARIYKPVSQLRKEILTNPLLAGEDRARNLEAESNANPRSDRRAAAVIRYFGNQQFTDPGQPGFAKLTGMMEDVKESTTVRMAAASVLADSKIDAARASATRFAADYFCAQNPIPQYKADAEAILSKVLSDKKPTEVNTSDHNVYVLSKSADGKISFSQKKADNNNNNNNNFGPPRITNTIQQK